MRDKKKKILIIVLVAVAIITISGIGIYFGYHTWDEATCSKPKTCSICGKTEGEALGHKWRDATCTEPQICSVCNRTKGEKLGHNPDKWSIIKEATCTAVGEKEAICKRCKKVYQRKSQWQIIHRGNGM